MDFLWMWSNTQIIFPAVCTAKYAENTLLLKFDSEKRLIYKGGISSKKFLLLLLLIFKSFFYCLFIFFKEF